MVMDNGVMWLFIIGSCILAFLLALWFKKILASDAKRRDRFAESERAESEREKVE
jgi:hypothetical protein